MKGLGVTDSGVIESAMRLLIAALAFLVPLGAATAQTRPSLAFDPARVRTEPAPALRHALVSTLPPLPAEGETIQVDCLVSAEDGRVVRCDDPANATPQTRAAGIIALGYRFKTDGLDQGAVLYTMTIPIRLSEADKHSLDFLTRQPTEYAKLVFTDTPSAEIMRFYYPRRALREGLQPTLTLVCEAQPDLRLFCLPYQVDSQMDHDTEEQFEIAAFQISTFYRLAPQRTDGSPAPGAMFGLRLNFRLPEQPTQP
jgi:hypothetical protein